MSDQEVKIEITIDRQTPVIGMEVTGGAGVGSGSGGVADRLATARRIALGGDAQGDAMFDGSQDVTLYTAVSALSNLELEEMLR